MAVLGKAAAIGSFTWIGFGIGDPQRLTRVCKGTSGANHHRTHGILLQVAQRIDGIEDAKRGFRHLGQGGRAPLHLLIEDCGCALRIKTRLQMLGCRYLW